MLPGLVFRFDGPLFFANSQDIPRPVRRLAAAEPRPGWIIVAAEPVTDVDTTAADMLRTWTSAERQGTSLVFAELKDPVRDKMERYGLTGPFDPQHFFPTLEAAVAAFRQRPGAEWTTAGQPTDHPTGTRPNRRRNRAATRHSRITSLASGKTAITPDE